MTHRRSLRTAYDDMLAEIQMDSDEETRAEAEAESAAEFPQERVEQRSRDKLSAAREGRARGKTRRASPPPSRQAKACDDSDETDSGDETRARAAEAGRRRRSEAKHKDSDPKRRRSSSPARSDSKGHFGAQPPRRNRYSRSGSRSHNSEGEAVSDSDDSDIEREAPVTNANRELFVAASAAGTATSSADAAKRTDILALRSFLTRAPSRGEPAIRCYVERDRQGLNRLHPVFRLFLEAGQQFLLCAQKRVTSKTANYLLTMEQQPTDRHSALVVGKLRSNWSGSEYTVYDDGLSPSKTALDANVRRILANVDFSYDEMGPGKLLVRVPQVQRNGVAAVWKAHEAPLSASTTAPQVLEHGVGPLLLRNKRPQYDAKAGGHVLDFGGRVTMASIKNFQMQCDTHGDDTVLQFGRVSCQPPGPREQCKCHKNIFTMDVKHPLSPLQAFAICLATLDTKFTDSKLYDNVSKLIKRK